MAAEFFLNPLEYKQSFKELIVKGLKSFYGMNAWTVSWIILKLIKTLFVEEDPSYYKVGVNFGEELAPYIEFFGFGLRRRKF